MQADKTPPGFKRELADVISFWSTMKVVSWGIKQPLIVSHRGIRYQITATRIKDDKNAAENPIPGFIQYKNEWLGVMQARIEAANAKKEE